MFQNDQINFNWKSCNKYCKILKYVRIFRDICINGLNHTYYNPLSTILVPNVPSLNFPLKRIQILSRRTVNPNLRTLTLEDFQQFHHMSDTSKQRPAYSL